MNRLTEYLEFRLARYATQIVVEYQRKTKSQSRAKQPYSFQVTDYD